MNNEEMFDALALSHRNCLLKNKSLKAKNTLLEKRAILAESKLDACKVDGFRDGFSVSGEGWNGEYGADIEEVVKEYADELRDN